MPWTSCTLWWKPPAWSSRTCCAKASGQLAGRWPPGRGRCGSSPLHCEEIHMGLAAPLRASKQGRGPRTRVVRSPTSCPLRGGQGQLLEEDQPGGSLGSGRGCSRPGRGDCPAGEVGSALPRRPRRVFAVACGAGLGPGRSSRDAAAAHLVLPCRSDETAWIGHGSAMQPLPRATTLRAAWRGWLSRSGADSAPSRSLAR